MNTSRVVKLIFAGGGTGGHLFPAVAIAEKLMELLKDKIKVEIIFVGTKRGIEYRLKDSLGYPLHLISMRGIARSLNLKNLLVPFIVVGALIKSGRLIKKFQPDMVVGTGGYVCWPVVKVAASRKIKTVLQEQNSYPGVATRTLASSVDKVYLGFESARQYLKPNTKTMLTGNPVRSSINIIDNKEACLKLKLDPEKKTILILGGSQGARSINQAVIKSIKVGFDTNKYQILWQTGKRDYKDVTEQTGDRVTGCSLFPFAENMSEVYSAADLVIARSGALTLAEIVKFNLPSLLIPFPFAAGNHQEKNAEDFINKKMAAMILEKDLDNHNLIDYAIKMIDDNDDEGMKNNIIAFNKDKREAVELIAEDIIGMLNID